MKIQVYPHITSAVDFINHGTGLAIHFADITDMIPEYICLGPVDIEINVNNSDVMEMALKQIEKTEDKIKAEMLEKLGKLKEEKEKLLCITYQEV